MTDFGKGWRTFAIAALTVVIGGVTAIDDPQDWKAWAIIVAGALMAGLRAMTNTPPGARR